MSTHLRLRVRVDCNVAYHPRRRLMVKEDAWRLNDRTERSIVSASPQSLVRSSKQSFEGCHPTTRRVRAITDWLSGYSMLSMTVVWHDRCPSTWTMTFRKVCVLRGVMVQLCFLY